MKNGILIGYLGTDAERYTTRDDSILATPLLLKQCTCKNCKFGGFLR